MNYSFCKLLVDEDYFNIIEIMSEFDCTCSLMTKVEMIGHNLSDGDYAVMIFDEEYQEPEIEFVIVVEDGHIDTVEVESYFEQFKH